MDEQLEFAMPVIGVQVTIRRVPGRGWAVDRRVLRDGQGWQLAGRWQSGDRRTAELDAAAALDQAWYVEPLD
uniref:Uncharacterized protein n=1 Tax=uncultured prokaryote TaxID=198431 RepID=A0A0H5QBW4_9ZZZZ|nr:hypothetical protein [uncultured prokaryote]